MEAGSRIVLWRSPQGAGLLGRIVEVTPGSKIVEVTPGSRIVRSYCGGHPREQDCIVEVTPGSRIVRSYCGGHSSRVFSGVKKLS